MGNSRSTRYYHGKMTAKDAQEKLLLPGYEHGSFLIRDSESRPDCKILSLRYANIVLHTPIKRSEDGGVFIYKSKVFRTLEDLVDYYSKNPDGICVNLKKPYRKTKKYTANGLSHNARRQWEMDQNSLKFIGRLGEGSFGIVYEGLHNHTKVAIKTLKEGTMETKAFIEEAQIMRKLKHPNLVVLFGVCSRAEKILIVTELMKYGTLLKFLNGKEKTLKFPQLLDIAAQIAGGMDYLESRNYVHRDLAARNILVGKNDVIKICDFGLARLIKDHEYLAHTGEVFPIKWTPPEAAFDNKYSTKSDVWSFGILLTELVTYGGVPYPGMTESEVQQETRYGYRMKCPSGCSPELYSIMCNTWEGDPMKRPSFRKLQLDLLKLSIMESKSRESSSG